MYILDLVQNSISANAKLIIVEIIENSAQNMKLSIKDDGKGIKKSVLANVADPFYTTRTTRKVGLGLPMVKFAAESSGGSFSISSVEGSGTYLELEFNTKHLDCPPFGNMGKTIAVLLAVNPDIDFVYRHKANCGDFVMDTRILKQALKEVPINNFEVIEWIEQHINEGIEEISGGRFYEIT